ncbi:MAG: hypothetical protein RJR34_13125 [Candidatus Methanoculleus thermohydrogenotrophicum]|nr:hypothetical protein [Candidatus Methanoculleus thermohydrogenotrophicum]
MTPGSPCSATSPVMTDDHARLVAKDRDHGGAALHCKQALAEEMSTCSRQQDLAICARSPAGP